jgi:homocitrate synthase NifV
MSAAARRIAIRDVSLREGLDVPGVNYTGEQKRIIVRLLQRANVSEIEIVAPAAVPKDLEFARSLKREGCGVKLSGLVYASGDRCADEIGEAAGVLDRVDLLMPASPKRKPFGSGEKIELLMRMLEHARRGFPVAGVGFPHSMQVETGFLLQIAETSARNGAGRVTIYDTNGGADPFHVAEIIKELKKSVPVPLFFHGHNDLGLATANSLAAVRAGADGLDASVNGLGDRAGNASLEQVVMCLHHGGFETGVAFGELRALSKAVEAASGVRVSPLAPVVGEHAFAHKSPSHLEHPELFEAFDPRMVGVDRTLNET